MNDGHNDREADRAKPTMPPSAAESYAVAVFETAIAKLGENRARMLNLAIKCGEVTV